MSYNGSGTFNINTTGQPVVAGTVISSSAFNSLTSDLATGLSTAITKDGQTTTTARITFAQGITSSLVTDSSSVSTGSIITAGGAGIAKNLYVGGIASFSAQPIFTSLTASSAVATDASKGLVSVTNTGTGNNVLATSPTLVTPILGTPQSVTLTSATGLPLSTGVTGILSLINGGTGLSSIGASGTRLLSDGTNAAWQATWFKVGSFTRDISLASGTQSVTGVGFKPKAVIFIGGSTGSGAWTIGYADGTNSGALIFVGPTLSTTNALGIDQAGGNNYFGGNPTLDTDGFTISWTKTGNPSGTYTFNYLALR